MSIHYMDVPKQDRLSVGQMDYRTTLCHLVDLLSTLSWEDP